MYRPASFILSFTAYRFLDWRRAAECGKLFDIGKVFVGSYDFATKTSLCLLVLEVEEVPAENEVWTGNSLWLSSWKSFSWSL